MKSLISFLACLFLVPALPAQETDGFSFNAHTGLTFTSGNSNSDQINVGFNAEKVTETVDFSLKSFYDYGRSEETKDDETVEITNLDKGKIEANGKYIFSRKTFAYVAISLERDEIAGIDRRLAAGPGIGHFFRRDDVMTLSVEGGGVWVFEEIDDESDDYLALRLAQNLKWAIRDGARLRQEIELIADVEDEENYFINANIIAEAALTASLGLRAEARSSYNNQPGRDKEQHDVTLRYGVSVSW